MPTKNVYPSVESEPYAFLGPTLEQARRLQTQASVHEAWDRVLPSGEAVHRHVVEPLAVVYSSVESMVQRHKTAAVLGAGALAGTVGFMTGAVKRN